jgi:hypothetical protein
LWFERLQMVTRFLQVLDIENGVLNLVRYLEEGRHFPCSQLVLLVGNQSGGHLSSNYYSM